MNLLRSLFDKEPTVTLGAIGGLVTAAIALAVAFGFHISQEQATAINVFVASLGTLVTLLVIRSQVTPNGNPTTDIVNGPAVIPPASGQSGQAAVGWAARIVIAVICAVIAYAICYILVIFLPGLQPLGAKVAAIIAKFTYEICVIVFLYVLFFGYSYFPRLGRKV